MAKQQKILDVNEGRMHLVCIKHFDRSDYNPYRVYAVISIPGAPVRKRQLVKYGDFVSVLCFIKDFYLNGLDSMPVCDIIQYIKERSI